MQRQRRRDEVNAVSSNGTDRSIMVAAIATIIEVVMAVTPNSKTCGDIRTGKAISKQIAMTVPCRHEAVQDADVLFRKGLAAPTAEDLAAITPAFRWKTQMTTGVRRPPS